MEYPQHRRECPDPYVYPYSLEHAERNRHRPLYDRSKEQNLRCAEDLGRVHWAGEDSGQVFAEDMEDLVEVYGYDRVQYVLAANLRFPEPGIDATEEQIAWARDQLPRDITQPELAAYALALPGPEMLYAMTNQVRRCYRELGLLDGSICEPVEESLEGRVLLLKPSALHGGDKRPENQFVLADGGRGCNPRSGDIRVFCTFLRDGKTSIRHRDDFYSGAVADEHLPGWVRETLQETQGGHQGEALAIGPVMQM